MANQDRAGLENIFFELAREVRKRLEVVNPDLPPSEEECMDYIKRTLSGSSPTDAQINVRVDKLELNDSEARYVILKIANAVQAENREIAISVASVEHIFPKNPFENEWGGQENHAKLEPLLLNIGNLTMLGTKLNGNRAKNSEYEVKKEIYRNDSKVRLTQSIAERYEKWDVKSILERARHLTDKALQIWQFDNLSKV